MNNTYLSPGMKLSDLITGDPFLLLLLEHLEIGLGLHEKTISDICQENKIDEDLFLMMANLYIGNNPPETIGYSSGVIRTIIGYLKNSHLYYLGDKYPLIKSCIEEINTLNDTPEIQMIGKFFDKYFIEVKEHLDYEDNVVFPYVIGLDDLLSGKKQGNIVSDYRVNDYREHHDDIEEKLEDLNNLLIRYMPQKNDGKIRRKLLLYLYELAYDLRIHSRVEEIILIPLVEKMESLSNTPG